MCLQPAGFPLGTRAHQDVTGPAGAHSSKEVGHSAHTTEVIPRVIPRVLPPHSFSRMDSCCAAGQSEARFTHRNSLQLLPSSLFPYSSRPTHLPQQLLPGGNSETAPQERAVFQNNPHSKMEQNKGRAFPVNWNLMILSHSTQHNWIKSKCFVLILITHYY